MYLLDSSYDLKKHNILHDLEVDKTITPLNALVYPGLLSGLVTFTNAHYAFVPLSGKFLWISDGVSNFRNTR